MLPRKCLDSKETVIIMVEGGLWETRNRKGKVSAVSSLVGKDLKIWISHVVNQMEDHSQVGTTETSVTG